VAVRKKKRSRAVLEALLMEEELSEEALKDQAALKRIEERLESYINLRAPEEAPLSAKLEEDREHNCFKLICSTRHNGTGLRTVVDRELLISPEYKELKRLFDELTGGGYPPYVLENGDHGAQLGSLKDLLEYVMETGKKGQYIQ